VCIEILVNKVVPVKAVAVIVVIVSGIWISTKVA
jgi:hypothetical protein